MINWFLDSSQLPRRHKLLAQRLTSSLAQLCCHKLASVTVFKLINQSIDLEASRAILVALIDEESTTLEQILCEMPFLTLARKFNMPIWEARTNNVIILSGDQANGISSVSRVVSSNFVPLDLRETIIGRVRSALCKFDVNVGSYFWL